MAGAFAHFVLVKRQLPSRGLRQFIQPGHHRGTVIVNLFVVGKHEGAQYGRPQLPDEFVGLQGRGVQQMRPGFFRVALEVQSLGQGRMALRQLRPQGQRPAKMRFGCLVLLPLVAQCAQIKMGLHAIGAGGKCLLIGSLGAGLIP